MTMEESEMRLRELLSKGATEEEILKKLTLAEGCGLKLWCEDLINPASGKKVHRYCGYIKKCDDPSENIGEPICGDWMDGPCTK
jgi:hypothetical protein